MRLHEYLACVGVAPPLPPTIDTLRRLHVAHLGAFPFENLEIQRGGSIRIDLESIERKFLSGQGGYCFEQNTLFGAVLRALGFEVTTLLARVGPPETNVDNHMILRVEVDGSPWLADVGFGGEGFLEPIPFADGVRVLQDGIEYSLRRDGETWTLSMHYGDTTEDQYQFTEVPRSTDEIEAANRLTSDDPSSIFRRSLTIQRVTPQERVILRPRVVTRYRAGVRIETPSEPAEVRRHARELFGIELGESPLLFERIR